MSRPSWVRRGASVASEVGMVVFAVVIALWFEGWNEERELRLRAAEVREAVQAEIEANLAEFERTGVGLSDTAAQLGRAIDEGTMAALAGSVEFQLAEVSSAAWTSARTSQAARLLDYEWVIEVARAYESYAVYQRLGDRAVDAVAGMVAHGPDADRVRELYGPIVLLTDVHVQVEARFRTLAEDGRLPGPDGS